MSKLIIKKKTCYIIDINQVLETLKAESNIELEEFDHLVSYLEPEVEDNDSTSWRTVTELVKIKYCVE